MSAPALRGYRIYVHVVHGYAMTVEAEDQQHAHDLAQDELDSRGLERFEAVSVDQCRPHIIALNAEMGA